MSRATRLRLCLSPPARTTLDGLGIAGAMAHTLEEYILLDSIVPRAKLLAGLLTAVAE